MIKWILVFLPVFAFAQVEFLEYIETEYDRMNFDNQAYNFGYTKLRLDFESGRNDVLIAGNINIQKYFGKTTWNMLDFLPNEMWESAFNPPGTPDSSLISDYPLAISDTLYLDNLYARLSFSKADITVGQQPLSLGSGYAWNPLDIFNSKDIMDPTYDQPGVMAFRIEIPFGDRNTFDAILAPAESWELAKKMVGLKSGVGRFDISMHWAQANRLIPYWRIVDYPDTNTHYKTMDYLGITTVGQIGDVGLWFEGVQTMGKWEHNEFVFGSDYTFSTGTFFMVEYLYNTLGAEKNSTQFVNYMNYLMGETHSLNQNYSFFMIRHSMTDFISLGLFGIANLDDKSIILNPTVDWDIKEDVLLSLYYSQSIGEKDTEFGLQDSAIRLRIRAHF